VEYRLLIILVFLHRLSKNYKNPWIITNEVSQAWLNRNQKGENKAFLPEPYNWKTYGDMNVEFWKKHQATSLSKAKDLLEKSHSDVMNLIENFTNEQLFSKGFYKWTGGTTLGSYFVSSTSSHYDWAMKKLKAHQKNCKK